MNNATRQANQADYQWLYELKVATMCDYVTAVYGWDDIEQKKFFDEGFRPEQITIITVDGVDAGMFELSRDDDGFFIKRIEVHPQYQGQSVGSTVIRDILTQASSAGESVRLMVFKINPAQNLYKRLGFKIVEETETHYLMKT